MCHLSLLTETGSMEHSRSRRCLSVPGRATLISRSRSMAITCGTILSREPCHAYMFREVVTGICRETSSTCTEPGKDCPTRKTENVVVYSGDANCSHHFTQKEQLRGIVEAVLVGKFIRRSGCLPRWRETLGVGRSI